MSESKLGIKEVHGSELPKEVVNLTTALEVVIAAHVDGTNPTESIQAVMSALTTVTAGACAVYADALGFDKQELVDIFKVGLDKQVEHVSIKHD